MNTDHQSVETDKARTPIRDIRHKETTEKIIGVFYDVYNELGHGFLESFYERSVAIGLREARHHVVTQAPIAVYFLSQLMGDFRTDLLVNDEVTVEIKAACDRARPRSTVDELPSSYQD